MVPVLYIIATDMPLFTRMHTTVGGIQDTNTHNNNKRD